MKKAGVCRDPDWCGMFWGVRPAPGSGIRSGRGPGTAISGLPLASNAGLLYQPVEITTAKFSEETSSYSVSRGRCKTAPGERRASFTSTLAPYQYGWIVHSGECQWIVLSSKRNCVVTAIGL